MSTKQHRRSRGKQLLANFMAVAMLAGAAVMGVGAGSVGVASATLAGSNFNGLDGILDVTNGNHTVTSVADPVGNVDTTNYTNGASEPTFCPGVGTGQAPNKADIDKLSFGVEHPAGALFVYLAWHRFTPDGTATIDFELNQGTAKCSTATNTFNPLRMAGDLLITYDFQGGNSLNVSARMWTGTAQNGSWGAPSNLTSLGAAESSFGTPAGANADELFGEAVVDLAKVPGFFPPGACKNVASVYAK